MRLTLKEPSEKRCTATTVRAVQRSVASRVGFAEHAVDIAACIVHDVEDARLLFRVGRVGTLEYRRGELSECSTEFDHVGVGTFGDFLPWRGLRLRGGRPAFVGQLEELLAASGFGRGDEPLIDEQLQRRIDRARARTPQAVAALGDLLDHFVAVHWPLGQQRKDRGANITATPSSAAAVTAATAGAEARAEAESESARAARAEAGTEAGTEAAAVAELGAGLSQRLPLEHLLHLATRLASGVMHCPASEGAEAEAF
jgi:hypothetical protein